MQDWAGPLSPAKLGGAPVPAVLRVRLWGVAARGDNRIYWKTGRRGRLNVRAYILLNLSSKIRNLFDRLGPSENFPDGHGALYLLIHQTCFVADLSDSQTS